MKVYSAVVSRVVAAGFADLIQAANALPGQEFTSNRGRLKVDNRVATDLADEIHFDATLRTTALLPSLKVEVVVSPWSADRSEVAIHPITRLGQLDSYRARRFFNAAHSVLPVVIDHLNAELVEAPAALKLAA
jgi:hypothetical protein